MLRLRIPRVELRVKRGRRAVPVKSRLRLSLPDLWISSFPARLIGTCSGLIYNSADQRRRNRTAECGRGKKV
jgi:hypothetical protein